MKYLSFKYYFKFGKIVLLIQSFIGIAIILVLMVYYLMNYSNIKYEVVSLATVFFVYNLYFTYYLLKSKTIKYDFNSLYIQNKNSNEEIPINHITRIKRTYYYFYTIYIKENETENIERKVVFFDSPNPSFSKSKNVKEILSYAEK